MRVEAAKDVHRILTEDRRVIDRALDRGIRKAILRHRQDGVPVVIAVSGQIKEVPAEDLGY